jgi:hypothetical protein
MLTGGPHTDQPLIDFGGSVHRASWERYIPARDLISMTR